MKTRKDYKDELDAAMAAALAPHPPTPTRASTRKKASATAAALRATRKPDTAKRAAKVVEAYKDDAGKEELYDKSEDKDPSAYSMAKPVKGTPWRVLTRKNPPIEEIEIDDDDDLVELEAAEADEDLDGASNVLENPRRYARENPGVVSGAIVGGTVAVAAGGWWLWRRRERAKLVAMVKANPVAAHAYPKIEQVAAKHISYFNTTTAEQAWEALDPNGLLSLGGSVWGTK